MILEIERLWSKAPGWYDTLDRDERARLMAWYRVHSKPAGKRRGPREPREPRGRG